MSIGNQEPRSSFAKGWIGCFAAVDAVRPKPLNLLVSSPIGLSVEQLADFGIRRISLGSGLNHAAWGGFLRAARMLAEQGCFDALGEAEPFDALNGFFRAHGRGAS